MTLVRPPALQVLCVCTLSVALVCAAPGATATPVFDGDLASAVTSWLSSGAHAAYGNDIATWDVSQVRNFSAAFKDKTSFNADISAWNTSRATDMSELFRGAISFDQDLSAWQVQGVTSFAFAFDGARAFNNGGNGAGLAGWRPVNATSLYSMF